MNQFDPAKWRSDDAYRRANIDARNQWILEQIKHCPHCRVLRAVAPRYLRWKRSEYRARMIWQQRWNEDREKIYSVAPSQAEIDEWFHRNAFSLVLWRNDLTHFPRLRTDLDPRVDPQLTDYIICVTQEGYCCAGEGCNPSLSETVDGTSRCALNWARVCPAANVADLVDAMQAFDFSSDQTVPSIRKVRHESRQRSHRATPNN